MVWIHATDTAISSERRHFNRSIRLWARKNGYSLSDHALVRRLNDDEKGPPIAVASEEDIFRLLGLEYVAPKDRDV
jgi:DNA polymerase/3'-5' exonuclease PolX